MNKNDEKILNQYNKVFIDEKVIACGRNECIKLIELLNLKYSDVDFGNSQTGFLNIDNIKKYIEKIKGGYK